MADLVSHLASGLLPAGVFHPRAAVPLAVGVTVPDLSGRAPQMALAILKLPIPDAWLWTLDVLHQPLPQLMLAGLFALGFREDQRLAVWGWTSLGVILHFGLDVLQNHHGHGYHLFFPASLMRWELGWIGSEATVAWAPWLLLATVIVWGVRGVQWRMRTAPRDDGSGGKSLT